MFKKEPLIKKTLATMLAGLIVIIAVLILSDLTLFKLIYTQGVDTQSAIYRNILVKNGVIAVLIIAVNLLLLFTLWKQIINRLEKLSRQMDLSMDGKFPELPNDNEEGILSRLEGQYYQLARRLQLSLRDISREKEELNSVVTDISHQIKTPLASLKIFNNLLLEGDLTQPEELEFLQRTQEQINKLEWLANSLIKISRMETGMIQLKKESADIKQTILAAVNEVYLKSLAREVEIDVHNLPNWVIAHDCKWTREAIVNILENAIKYTDAHGVVKITMQELESHIKIDIEDNGIGIPAHEMGQIFNRFYRGEAELIKKSEGSGIGLYLSRKIIEEQGGGLIVNSEFGQGSCFTILLGK